MIKIKTLLVSIFIFFTLTVTAQIKPFQFDGYKDYPNGRRIAYFYVQGISCNHEASFIMDNMTQLDEIYRFSIYTKKGDQNYCMIECDQNINEDYIYKLMLQFETEYNDSKQLDPSFPKYVDTGNPQEDNARYEEAKQKWIEKNPEKYKKIAHPNGIITNEPKKCKH